ncbi:flavin reductase family protein [Cellulomonas telluris]|uniref:flavin reductase family protein n=1 Tax=Cellulomonas telluris TaxID=2306636 RepID=UPI0010A8B7D5|nr:flavin reductase family protein [Cellulomonas telluris]
MPISAERFREIFGSFPTAVSVVTTLDADGQPRGLTSNTVCAVSVDPPMLLVAVDKSSNTLPAMRASAGFVVNVLAGGNAEVSRIFARKSADKFADLEWRASEVAAGAPILVDHAVAVAECSTERAVEAGDHWLFLGRVDEGATYPRPPLLHRRGVYGEWPLVAEATS